MNTLRAATIGLVTGAMLGACTGADRRGGAGSRDADHARPPAPMPGHPAPPLALTGLLQAPEGVRPGSELSWDDLKGQVVVLEFWATWCGPCVAAIPHLNALADEFRDQPVRFISVTAEDEAKVREFLGRRAMTSWVGLDADRVMQRAYRVSAIPTTFLVDRRGVVAGVTHPTMLNAHHIRAVLDDRPAGLSEPESQAAPATVDSDAGPEPILRVVIRPAQGHGGVSSRAPGQVRCDSTSIAGLIRMAHDWHSSIRTVLPDDLDTASRYALLVNASSDDAMLDALRASIAAAFGVTARVETREMDVLVAEAPQGPGPGLIPAASEGSMVSTAPGMLRGIGIDFGTFILRIEEALGRHVVDETGITGRFDADLAWTAGDQADEARVLSRETGIVLHNDRRPIEVLVVERRPGRGP